MRTFVLLLALTLISCNKKESINSTQIFTDSAVTNSFHDSSNSKSEEGVVLIDTTHVEKNAKTFRTVENGKIIKTINADMIPLTLSDEFTEDQQQYVLKIKNFTRQNISGDITPENSEMNIRFNQIRLPNGDFEGPFGRGMMFKTRENGEIWLIIGKSNMASGETKGRFSVSIR